MSQLELERILLVALFINQLFFKLVHKIVLQNIIDKFLGVFRQSLRFWMNNLLVLMYFSFQLI